MNRPKQIGTAAETAVVRYARANGFPLADRRALAGNVDKGDILLCPGAIVEVKAHKRYSDNDVLAWLEETRREQLNANASRGLLVVKRPGKSGATTDAACGSWWAVWLDAHGKPVYMHLRDALFNLRGCGWGDPL